MDTVTANDIISMFRRRYQKGVTAFLENVERNSVASAIKWDATAAITAEIVLAYIDRFEEQLTQHGPEAAAKYIDTMTDYLLQRQSYFDPTNQSTSAASTYVENVEYAANKEVLDRVLPALDEALEQLDIDDA